MNYNYINVLVKGVESMLIAIYDCRSKQEYIYRTNRVQEIVGASELLRDLFKGFFNICDLNISTDWENLIAPDDYFGYFRENDLDAEVVYEGGGNLCMIFKDEDTYKKFNRKFSRYALDKAYNVSIIASAAEIKERDGGYDFVEDRNELYRRNAWNKNTGSYYVPCNILPFTQVDRLTFQPIVKKTGSGSSRRQFTAESLRKQMTYDALLPEDNQIIEKEFDNMVDKGTESLLAIIYIDGNNMGEKLKNRTHGLTGYAQGITALRDFSKKTNQDFVVTPIQEISKRLTQKYNEAKTKKEKIRFLFRRIISGGDEITLVCNARAVPLILETYFDTLIASGDNTACAGVAIFHSHAPFADVYEIAEQCCENAKKKAHVSPSDQTNYIDFHYCHSGITNSLDVIRERQEGRYTARPYEYSGNWQEFIRLGTMIAEKKGMKLKRSDVKELSDALNSGESYYKAELKRIQSRQTTDDFQKEIMGNPDAAKFLYDISIVYDLWFRREED